MAFETIEQMIRASAAGVKPPERLTVAEAAEKLRKLNNPGSYVGMWDNKIAPYLVEPMEVLTSFDFTGMIFAGPARTGKSDMVFNWIAHTAKHDPADMMVVNMTINTARDWSQGDLRKFFRHSEEIGALVAPGKQNMSSHSIRFMSGMRILVKWPTITELSGKTSPRNWLLDYDRMPESIDGEGSAYMLTAKRAQTYNKYGMTVAESSPGYSVENPKWIARTPHEAPPTKGILSLYNSGDRRRWYWKCPHCREAFEPDFHLMHWPESQDLMESAEAAYMVCPHCHKAIFHESRHGLPGKYELNLGGKWIKDGMIWTRDGKIEGKPYRSDIASFWMKGPCAAFLNWHDMVLKYLKAEEDYERTGSQEALKTTVNTDQGLPFSPRAIGEELLPETLKARAKFFGEYGVVPEGVRFLIATVDVQGNRFEVAVWGVGANGDLWIVDRFAIRKSKRLDDDGEHHLLKPASYAEDWYVLVEQVMLKTYPLADGSDRQMQIKLTGCDSAGEKGATPNAYKFWRFLRDGPPEGSEETSAWVPNLHRRFQLLKGETRPGIPRYRISYPDSDRKDRHAGSRGEVPVGFINTVDMKDWAHKILLRTSGTGSMVHFADWLPDEFYAEMVAERRTARGWENPNKLRNEAWDLLVYVLSLCLDSRIGLERIDWENPPAWAAPWDENDLVSEEVEQPRFEAVKKTEYTLANLAAQLA